MHPYDDCSYCGGQVSERRERLDYRYHGQLYIVENVPLGVCGQCGEKFLTATVAKRIEAAVAGSGTPARTIPVSIVTIPA